MNPHDPYAPPGTDPLPGSPVGTPQGALFLAFVSFTAVFVVYVFAQAIQLANLPFGLLFTSLMVFGAAGLLFPLAFNLRPFDFTGFGRIPWKLTGFAFLIGLANLIFVNFAMRVLQETLPEEWSRMAEQTMRLLLLAEPDARVVLVLAAAVAAPIGEELFFRGWMQGVVAQRIRAAAAVTIVAVVFSAMHLDPVGFLPRVELGILFGLVRIWSGSLWPAIAMHAAHNGVSLVVLYASDDPLAELDQPFPWAQGALLAAVSLAATVFLLATFRRQTLGTRCPERDPLPCENRLPPFATNGKALARPLAATVVGGLAVAALILGYGEKLPGGELTRMDRSLPAAEPVPSEAPAEQRTPR